MVKFYKIFIVCLCSFFLFSCAEKDIDGEIPSYDESFDAENVDFNGYEYIIHNALLGTRNPLDPTYGEDADGDLILERYAETEKKYNINITVYGGCSLSDYLVYFAAGNHYADIMLNREGDVTQSESLQKGYFTDYSIYELDFTSGMYGSPQALLANTFKGGVYGILAYYWNIPISDTMPALWFNPVVLNNFSQPSPHELDEKGEWSWDAFEKICSNVLDTTSSDTNEHIYAVCYTSEPYLEFAAIYSNNGRFVSIDENGRLSYAFNSPNVIEALEFVAGLSKAGYMTDGGDRQNITPFVEDKRAFFLEFTHLGVTSTSTTNLSFMMEHEYEWINFPAGPRADENMISTSYSYYSRFFYSPLTASVDVNTYVIPFMFRTLGDKTEENYLDSFKSVNFYSEKSFQYFLNIRENAFFDYTCYTPFTSYIYNYIKGVTRLDRTASEIVVALEEPVQESLDRLYNDYIDD